MRRCPELGNPSPYFLKYKRYKSKFFYGRRVTIGPQHKKIRAQLPQGRKLCIKCPGLRTRPLIPDAFFSEIWYRHTSGRSSAGLRSSVKCYLPSIKKYGWCFFSFRSLSDKDISESHKNFPGLGSFTLIALRSEACCSLTFFKIHEFEQFWCLTPLVDCCLFLKMMAIWLASICRHLQFWWR